MPVYGSLVEVVEHQREGEFAEGLAIAQLAQAAPQVLDVRLLAFVYQHISLVQLARITGGLRDEPSLRHVEMFAPFVDFPSGFLVGDGRPLCHGIEVGRNL